VFHHAHHALGLLLLIEARRRPRVTSILRLQLPTQGRLHALVKRVRFFPTHGSGSHKLACLSSSCIGINGSGSWRRKCYEAYWKSGWMKTVCSTHNQQVATRGLGFRVYEHRCYGRTTIPICRVPVGLQIMSDLRPRYQGTQRPSFFLTFRSIASLSPFRGGVPRVCVCAASRWKACTA